MYLGMDIGTSGVKAVLVNAAGAIAATAARGLGLSHPAPLWSEQDPDAWVDAAIGAVDDLAALHPRDIGLSGQMHGAALLDDAGKPLRPAILWNDGRSNAECARLERRCPSLHKIAGNLAIPGFTAPKLLGVARHEPEIFERVAKVLLPKAYVRYRLTGEMVEDMSDAAGTLWLDVDRRRWSALLLHATRLDLHHMPRLVEGSEVSAFLAADFAERWDMARDIVVAGGAGDCAASAIGLGAIAPADAFLSLGSSGVMFRVTDRFVPAPASAVHAFCHALPDLWHQMGVMLSAAASLAWLAGVMATPASALHEVALAEALGVFGSLDINRGDDLLGWDTDQFAMSVPELALVFHEILNRGGFTSGGLNFDATIRRQSIDPDDLIHARVGLMDACARALLSAADMLDAGVLTGPLDDRYAAWADPEGRAILAGQRSLPTSPTGRSRARSIRSRAPDSGISGISRQPVRLNEADHDKSYRRATGLGIERHRQGIRRDPCAA